MLHKYQFPVRSALKLLRPVPPVPPVPPTPSGGVDTGANAGAISAALMLERGGLGIAQDHGLAPNAPKVQNLINMMYGSLLSSGQSSHDLVVYTVRSMDGGSRMGYIRAEVPVEMTDNFSFSLPAAEREALLKQGKPYAVDMDNNPLPKWLHFEADRLRFIATAAPARALPITVKVVSGHETTLVEIDQATGNAPPVAANDEGTVKSVRDDEA